MFSENYSDSWDLKTDLDNFHYFITYEYRSIVIKVSYLSFIFKYRLSSGCFKCIMKDNIL